MADTCTSCCKPLGCITPSRKEVVATVNTFSAVIGGILAVIVLILGINSENFGVAGVGILVALITLISWALNRMFIGIAQDIKGIRARVESD